MWERGGEDGGECCMRRCVREIPGPNDGNPTVDSQRSVSSSSPLARCTHARGPRSGRGGAGSSSNRRRRSQECGDGWRRQLHASGARARACTAHDRPPAALPPHHQPCAGPAPEPSDCPPRRAVRAPPPPRLPPSHPNTYRLHIGYLLRNSIADRSHSHAKPLPPVVSRSNGRATRHTRTVHAHPCSTTTHPTLHFPPHPSEP